MYSGASLPPPLPGPPPFPLDVLKLIRHSCPLRYANTYPAALALLSSGALAGVEKMITHRFPLTESKRAFEVMKKGVDENGRLVVKVCIDGEQ